MLKLAVRHLEEIHRHGQESYPDECCGILIGKFDGPTRIVESTVRCQNAAIESPSTQYHIDPREVIRARRDVRERGLDVIGFYHSHPDRPAQWSPTDLAEAHWIGCSYLIVAVKNGTATETRSFFLSGTLEEDKRFTSEEVNLTIELPAQRKADS